MNFRTRAAQVLLALSATVFVSWLVGALVGGLTVFQSTSGRVSFGDFGNFRLGCWLALAAFVVTPHRLAWVDAAEKWLGGRARWGVPLAFTLYLVVYKIAQHLAFETTALDLSIFHYAVRYAWTDGPGFAWGFNLERSLFSEHFEPIVLWVVPLDMVFRSPLVLLIPEVVGVGLGLWFIVGCSHAYGIRPIAAWLLGAAYATNFTLWQSVRFDFHPEALLPAGIFATLWALKEKRYGWLAFAVFTVLCLKEDMAIVLVPAVALAWFDDRKAWKAPVTVSVVAMVWCVVTLKFVIPAARGPQGGWDLFAERYAAWGATPGEAVKSMLTRPLDLLPVIFGQPVIELMGQLGFVPLLNPLSLLASIPALLEQRLTAYETQHLLLLYYGIGPLTVWMVGAMRGVRWLSSRVGVVALVVVASLPMTWRPGPLAIPRVEGKHLEAKRLLGELIPEGARVSAQTIVVPHLPISEQTKLFPKRAHEADYVVLMPDEFLWPLEAPEYSEVVTNVLDSGDYGVLANTGKLVVLKRGAPLGDAAAVKAQLPR
ncbi:MAG: hypothetical protein DI536_34055 [Archangium gephyra]|uniref:DUF2079 domain-containing protein n=1 Tax=Archangium gephyra TaxID=48 RepID=A0A2W5SY81_9BACT|nr:MAG: hypothetical protein DI536_34055 [Archangium gephyra]